MSNGNKLATFPAVVLMAVACIASLAMMLHVVADVFMKKIFNSPIDGTLEMVSGYYMVLVVAFPLAYVTWGEGHLIVEIFTRRLAERRLAVLEAAVEALTFVCMAGLTWASVAEAIHRTKEGEVWVFGLDTLLIWPSRWVLAIGFGLMAVYVLGRFVRNIARVREG